MGQHMKRKMQMCFRQKSHSTTALCTDFHAQSNSTLIHRDKTPQPQSPPQATLIPNKEIAGDCAGR
jgi:hypothetical protein